MVAAVDPLAIGCIAAIIARSSFFLRLMEKICPDNVASAVVCMVILLLGVYLFIGFAYGHRSRELLSIGFSLIIVSLYFFRNALFLKALEWSPLDYLGTISYGIYVWQAVINGTGPNARWIESPFLSTALVFFVSIISYEFYEKRFLRLKKH